MNRVLAELAQRAATAARVRYRRAERSVARLIHPGAPIARGFFDDYPRYYSTSITGVMPNRLNQRYRALIEANKTIIAGKTVLDIGSHDGRWTFAALAIGASQVCGIEPRAHLIANAIETLRSYGVADDRYRFIQGDVFDEIDSLETGSIDTIFCFGFFYHTLHHLLLLSKIGRLKPLHLIIDTLIDLRPVDAIFLRRENTEDEWNIASAPAKEAVVGVPSRGALEMMLASFGWAARYYDWHRAGIKYWDAGLQDYHEGWRVTLVVDCQA